MGTNNLVNTISFQKVLLRRNKTIIPSIFVTFVVPFILFHSAYADNPEVDQVNITVPVSCTLDGTGMDSHIANIQNRNYETEIGSTTLTAYCNDIGGFSIYAIGYSNEEYGNTDMIGVNTEGLIPTGTTLDGSVSNWAMKLETNNEATYPIALQNGYNAYKAVPSTYTLVAKRESSTDTGTSAIGSVLTSTYAISVSPSQVADTYVGKVRYTLVHPYDRVEPEPPMGLCTDSYTCMQQQTPASMAQKLPNVGDVAVLYDARDNQAYRVAKLADNKYWMAENLNIAGGTALSSEDTDFDASYELPTTDGWTVNNGKLVLPTSGISDLSAYNYACVYNSGNKTNNCNSLGCYSYYSWDAATLGSGRTLAAENTDADYSICPKGWRLPTSGDSSDNGWKRGDFYTLATKYGANMETSNNDSFNATSANFYNNAGPNTTADFLLAGYYSDSFTGGGGYYWSATSGSSSMLARYLGFKSGYVSSASHYYRSISISVRCLFNE